MDNTGKKRQLPECNCVSCLKEICVGALAGDFDYILAKDGIVKENGKYVVKSAEHKHFQEYSHQYQHLLPSYQWIPIHPLVKNIYIYIYI
jgi:hypothetical protein